MSKLPSTGRRPALNLDGVTRLLTRYFDEDQPGVEALASEFEVTPATVRKYLKLALGSLPRGRAANLPREARNVRALVNGIPTEALLGRGRCELLRRRREAGESLTALAREFGVSRDRVTKLVRGSEAPESTPSENEVETVPAPASEDTPTVDIPQAPAVPEVAMAAGDDA